MKALRNHWFCLAGLLVTAATPASATVRILSLHASAPSPQPIGTQISWSVTATDSGPGPLTFQFNVAAPDQALNLVKDFNAGTLGGGAWTAQPFVWVPTGPEGGYQIQVVIKDF